MKLKLSLVLLLLPVVCFGQVTPTGGKPKPPLLLTGTSDAVQVDVIGNATQTNPILRVKKSDGTSLFTIDNSGNLVFAGSMTGTFLLRTGTAASLDGIVLGAGEAAFSTDTFNFRVGDGSTTGGNPIGFRGSVLTGPAGTAGGGGGAGSTAGTITLGVAVGGVGAGGAGAVVNLTPGVGGSGVAFNNGGGNAPSIVGVGGVGGTTAFCAGGQAFSIAGSGGAGGTSSTSPGGLAFSVVGNGSSASGANRGANAMALTCSGGASAAGGSGGRASTVALDGSLATASVAGSNAGDIDLRGGIPFSTFAGGTGGFVKTKGGDGSVTAGGNGGNIDTRGAMGASGAFTGGNIDTSASSTASGGIVKTAGGGGKLDTTGTGTLELGVVATRTTLTGTGTAARAIALPDLSGTVALIGKGYNATAAGTAYTLTTTFAAVAFGTTSPTVTIATAGNYYLFLNVSTALVGATYAALDFAGFEFFRTNNTPAAIGTSRNGLIPAITTVTNVGPSVMVGPIPYTATAGDTVTVYGKLGTLPSVGSVTVDQASIVAIPQ